MNKRLFLSPPHMGGNEQTYINEAFESNYIAPVGKNLELFEQQLCSFTHAPACVALSSGTAALHLALRLSDVNEGDEVFVSTFTFIGSVAPILYQKATPVFIDSDTKSWNINPDLVEEEFKRRHRCNIPQPKALIAVHLYGQNADIFRLKSLCDEYHVTLIEDAAESLGATINDQQSGTIGDWGIYSFNGNKIITTSGGGALVSSPENIAKARHLSTQARDAFIHYEHTTYGYNYRMSNIVAGIGRGQMEVLTQRIQRRQEIFELYKNKLPMLEFMPELPQSCGNRWLSTALLPSHLSPYTLVDILESQNIESRPLWKPMHMQPLFSSSYAIGGQVSEFLFERGICLPSGSSMNDNDVERVCSLIKANL